MTVYRYNYVEPSAGGGYDRAGNSPVELDRDARQPDNVPADHLERTLDQRSRPAGYRMPRIEQLA